MVGDAVARMVAAVEAFGGTVKDLAGDGVLALFGAPVAHEDDLERAIRAGFGSWRTSRRSPPGGARVGRRGIERSRRRPDRTGRHRRRRRGLPRRVRRDGGRASTPPPGSSPRPNPARCSWARTRRRGRGGLHVGPTPELSSRGRRTRSRSRRGRHGVAGALGGRRRLRADGRARRELGAAREAADAVARRGRADRLRHRGSRVSGRPGSSPSPRGLHLREPRARPDALARGTMRELRRVAPLLAVPRPAPLLARRAGRRARAPRARRAPPAGRPAVRRGGRRRPSPTSRRSSSSSSTPKRRAGWRSSRPRPCSTAPSKCSALARPPRRRRTRRGCLRGPALVRRDVAACSSSGWRRHRDRRGPARKYEPSRAGPPVVAC